MTESAFVGVEVFSELSLWSKLGGPLHRSSVQTISKTDPVRAKATLTPESSMLGKLGNVTKFKPG